MNIECPNREKNVSNEMLLKSVFISITLCMVLGLSMLNPVYLSNRIYGVTNSTKNLNLSRVVIKHANEFV